MKKPLYLLVLLTGFVELVAQSFVPLVYNSGGGEAFVPDADGTTGIYFSIGEPIADDLTDRDAQYRLTQGFLQPDVASRGILAYSIVTSPMQCANANDAALSLLVRGLAPPYRFTWYKNGVQLADSANTLQQLGAGSYSFVLLDARANTRSGVVEIVNSTSNCKLEVYNGLSPNGDGHNDIFFIRYIGDYPGNRVSIYNRWGDLVWEARDYNNTTSAWDGTDTAGRQLPEGTYFYSIETVQTKTTGWVELFR